MPAYSQKDDRHTVCPATGKQCFSSYSVAENRIRWQIRNGNARDDWRYLKPYRCRHCHKYHVGTMPKHVANIHAVRRKSRKGEFQ